MPAVGAADVKVYVQLIRWMLDKIGLTGGTHNHKAWKDTTNWQTI